MAGDNAVPFRAFGEEKETIQEKGCFLLASTVSSTASYQLIHPDDSVLIALKPFQKGDRVTVAELNLEITIKEDGSLRSQGCAAAAASGRGRIEIRLSDRRGERTDRAQGEWVHTHNVKTKLEGLQDYTYEPVKSQVKAESSERTFMGYVRANGAVGIRNEIWIINTVGCINKTAEILAKMANDQFKNERIDGVYHFPHPFGCSQLGDDLQNTQKILSDLVHHSNAAGVLVIGLGCENNYVDSFKEVIGEYDERRVKFLNSQQVEDELEAGLDLIGELVEYAAEFERKPVPVSELKVGLKCGGSDGFSGITANPLVGAFSDLLISHGGTTILTEVPEMFGAETILMNRAADRDVFSKTVDLINGFKQYFIKHEQPVYENPSPGNKKGGITTLEEKSLGCVQKGGFAEVVDVLPYGGRVEKKGLNLVQGPGNDLVSVTALSAAGAHIVLFTTGRGTPFGGPVPTVKISTNTPLYERKKNWIDYNAGRLVEGVSMDELKQDFFEYVLRVASGEEKTKNEQNGFKEIAIFKDGVIL